MIYQLLNDAVELRDNGDKSSALYVSWDEKKVRYIAKDRDGTCRYFESTIHPEKLDRDQRHRVLGYCLPSFHDDEIVNYNDLFLQGEFIIEGEMPEDYELTEEWLC